MKKYIVTLISLFGFCIAQAQAQTLTFGPLHSADSPRADWLLPGDTIMQAGQKMIYQGKPMKNVKYTVSSPSWNEEQKSLSEEKSNLSPLSGLDENKGLEYGYGLHKGLNVSLGASAFATFGKGLPHKGGFSQNINATYLAPLSKDGKLWIAGGAIILSGEATAIVTLDFMPSWAINSMSIGKLMYMDNSASATTMITSTIAMLDMAPMVMADMAATD